MKKDKFLNIYIYINLVLILITSGGALLKFNSSIIDMFNITLIILNIFNILRIIKNINYIIGFLGIFILFLILNSMVHTELISALLIYLIRFINIAGFVYFTRIKKINLFEKLTKLIIFISIYSLIIYIIVGLIKIELPYKVFYAREYSEYAQYKSYMHLYYIFQANFSIGNIIIPRNSSVFWEPGVYQIFLNIALFYKLFIENKKRKLDYLFIGLLIISIVSTTSTTGIAMLLLMLLLKIIYIKNKNYLYITIKIICLCIGVVVIVACISTLYKNKMDKGYISLYERSKDLVYGIKLFMDNFILGLGYNNNQLYNIYANRHGNTNGLISFLYQNGIIISAIYFIIIKNFIKNISTKFVNEKVGTLAIAILILVSLMTEPLAYTNFVLLMISSGALITFDNIKIKVIKSRRS